MDLLIHSREKTTEAGKPGEEMDWSEMENMFEAITEMFDSKDNLFRGEKCKSQAYLFSICDSSEFSYASHPVLTAE